MGNADTRSRFWRNAVPRFAAARSWSRCAPPSGSGTISSTTPSPIRSCAVSFADAQRAARSAFTDDHSNAWHAQIHHLAQIHGDRFGDVTLFRADAWERAGRVDQRDHRHVELFREAHQAERFAISLGMGAAEISFHVFLRVAALLVRDHDAAM